MIFEPDPNLAPFGLNALNVRAAADLELINYPEPRWMSARTARDRSRALDALIVGAGPLRSLERLADREFARLRLGAVSPAALAGAAGVGAGASAVARALRFF